MVWACLNLVLVGLAVSLPATAVMRTLGRRLGALDTPGVPGQVKAAARRVPNTGGVAVYLGVVVPLLAALAALTAGGGEAAEWVTRLVPGLVKHMPGMAARMPEALILIAALTVLHVMGVIDDRRALGPWMKLGVMLGVALVVVWTTDTRLLTLLDARAGGPWLSIALTVVWLGVVTNAFNFLDNMDGLSAGVAAIAASFFLVAALVNGQWFVGACLALLVGSLLGFLWSNFPWRAGGATIFMGDGGSVVVGFLLGFLTVRTTYYGVGGEAGGLGGGWYGVFMPLVVLAVPIYDFCSVTLIRLSQGKSPFVGDLQHFSHRLVRRGMSKRAAVVVIYGLTAVTAIGGVSLARLEAWQAVLVGVQTLLVLGVLGVWEWSARASGGEQGSGR